MADTTAFNLCMNVGHAHNDLNQFDDAIIAYTEAIDIDPENHYGYECRGNAYRWKFRNSSKNIEDARKALNDFTEAKELYQSNFNVRMNMGYTYMDLGEYDDAIIAYTEGIEIDPKNYHGYECRGNAYREKFHNSGKHQDDAEKALEDFTKAKELYEKANDIPF